MAAILGKIIGGLSGLLIAGKVGAIIGFVLGHSFDMGTRKYALPPHKTASSPPAQQEIQQRFFESTFSVMGHIAKAQGRITEKHISYARRVMRELALNPHQQQEAMRLYYKGKKASFDVDGTCRQLSILLKPYLTLQRLFIDIQFYTASIGGLEQTVTQQALRNVCQQFGVDYRQIYTKWQREQWYEQQRNDYQVSKPVKNNIQQSYALLNLGEHASEEEVKQAYRKLVSQYHPDKLIAKGYSPEKIKLATEKMQQIHAAYEEIRLRRAQRTRITV